MPRDNFTLPWFKVSLLLSMLEKPIDIESPLTAKAIMRVPCEGRGEGQARLRQRAVLRSWTRLTLPDSKGFHLPSNRTPWLWVISTTTELQTRLVPREDPKHYFLNFQILTLEKNPQKHVLRKSLMRFGHARTVQKAPLFIQMLPVVPETRSVTPNLMEAEPL